MDYAALARESLDRVAASKPLIHQITNVVVTNDSANLTLAFGALPVMAYAPQEVAEMAAISATSCGAYAMTGRAPNASVRLAESFVTTTLVIWWMRGLLAATRSSDSRASAA